ncbi:cytochrome C assembly family protein [Marinagarivorans algicola]|uniref:cytochrome C assembly family protein n=1 Tax=Marinagarivorans algicola TaxID=1513270 RepID=UPI0006B610E8|nr:cytochrome c biogenesis protein CcsA [Marinagarivorans algicola]
MPITLTLALYCFAWFFLVRSLRQRQSRPPVAVPLLLAGALIGHAYSAYSLLVTPNGYDFSLFRIAPLFFWVANLLVLASSIRKPLYNMFALLLPLTALSLLSALFLADSSQSLIQLSAGVFAHIVLSIFAYSTLTIATMHALILAYQNKQLHNRHATGFVRLLPPLQTMEALLFELLWTGQLLLSAAIISGALFVEDMLAQHLVHKSVFSALAWLTYSVLLWGRHQMGWRGFVAVRWTLSGFGFLILAYFGSKLVLEIILG